MAIVTICSYKECIEKHTELYPKAAFSMRVNRNIEHYLEGLTTNRNFGNPFKTDDNAKSLNKKYKTDKYEGHGTVTEVSERFVKWVKGEVNPYTEPWRQRWIKKQLDEGKLDDVEFLYCRDDSKDSSHIRELVKYINECRSEIESAVNDLEFEWNVTY